MPNTQTLSFKLLSVIAGSVQVTGVPALLVGVKGKLLPLREPEKSKILKY